MSLPTNHDIWDTGWGKDGIRAHVVRRAIRLGCCVCAIWIGLVHEAGAQGGPGVRAGLAIDPDQFIVGAHVETGPIVDRLRFRPSLELGVGDNLTLIAINIEFAYWFPPPKSPWNVYVGGGPAINIFKREGHDSDLEPGLNVMLGLAHRGGLFTEFKIGALDSPSLRLLVGYTFH